MAMTILNNSATIMTLGELNKNITKVGKELSKVATGQKINSAGDDSASFAISEQMRAKIRGLEQDVQNVQNGASMLQTAMGGIQSIVDELRELKELAIDAANDSNTDADRAIMQRVLKQKQANIDNIAESTTFNTKSMLDGKYESPHWEEKYYIRYDHGTSGDGHQLSLQENEVMKYLTLDNGEDITGQNSKHGSYINNVNVNVIETMNTVTDMASHFTAMSNSIRFLDGTSSVETKDTALYSLKPQNIRHESTGYIVPNRNFIRSTGGAPIAVKMDFSGAIDKETGKYIFDSNGNTDSYNISKLNGQGFSLLFSDSSRAVTIRFDASASYTQCEWWNTFQSEDSGEGSGDGNTGDLEYTVGIADLVSRTDKISKEEFTEFVFNAIGNSQNRESFVNSFNHKYNLQDNAGCTIFGDVVSNNNPVITSGENTYTNYDSFVLSQKHNLRMSKGEDGEYYLTAYQRYSHSLGIIDEGWLGRALGEGEKTSDTEFWKFKVLTQYSSTTFNVASVREEYEYKEFNGNPLWAQHGTKANQHINVYISDMRNSAMMTDVTDVSTRDKAIASIDFFDVAIEYALNEAANVGAYLQRMEYTEANIVTESENTQAAESTIRDADMAKEMTEYTKNNVLAQASQSMLAQANQSMSSVLSLLQ